MSEFHREMREFVLHHGAINNSYLKRFKQGLASDHELYDFAVEFYNFARFFPKILVAQLVNTEDESVADELTRVLYSELGDGHPENRHELLYRHFLRSLDIDIHQALATPMMPSTQAYIGGLEALYSSGNHEQALGASFGLENMAITMWDHLIPGLQSIRRERSPGLDLRYFTFHRELESAHEEAMVHAVAALEEHSSDQGNLSSHERQEFYGGVRQVLDFLEGFWMGLEHQRSLMPPTHLHKHSRQGRVTLGGMR
ncbi:iron-containing redox enzyme family protein [uncultured Nitrospira sp.]|uniref:TenA family transcriptional regulator n=1 Tax=uncultured Nitrospira sp. TaxID=157176 RepID=UPI003140045E